MTSCKVIWKWQVFTMFHASVNTFFTTFISTILDIYSLNNLHLIWSVLWKWLQKSGHKYLSAIHTTLIKKCIQLCPNTLVWSYHTVLFFLHKSYCTHNPSTTIKIITVISNTGYRLHNLEPVSCNLSCSLLYLHINICQKHISYTTITVWSYEGFLKFTGPLRWKTGTTPVNLGCNDSDWWCNK